MEKLLLTLFSFIIVAWIIRLLTWSTNKRPFLLLFIWAFLITFFSLFLSSFIPLSFVTEKDIIKSFTNNESEYLQFLDSIDTRFTLIDVNGSKTINQDPVIPTKNTVITDRAKLSEFISFLRQNDSLFSMVVFDILFTEKSKDDSLLHAELVSLSQIHHKEILLAGEGNLSELKNKVLYTGLDSFAADVTDYPDEDNFFEHVVIKNHAAENKESALSLPYRLYNHISETHFVKKRFLNISTEMANTHSGHKSHFFSTIIPPIYTQPHSTSFWKEFFEKMHLHSEEEHEPDFTENLGDYNIQYLADLTSKEDTITLQECAENLKKQMSKRMAHGGKNIVFIGDFDQELSESDIHPTAVGPVKGSKIMLNIYYHLVSQKNKQVVPKFLILFFLVLFASWPIIHKYKQVKFFSLQAFKVFLQKLFSSKSKKFKKGSKATPSENFLSSVFNSLYKLKAQKRSISNWWTKQPLYHFIFQLRSKTLIKYLIRLIEFVFIEERHYWFLFGVLYLFYSFTGFIISIIPLFVLFFMLEFDLQIFVLKKDTNHHH